MNLFHRKDKKQTLAMVEELIESNRQLRLENKILRQRNIELDKRNAELVFENFRFTHTEIKAEGLIPGLCYYTEIRYKADDENAGAFKRSSKEYQEHSDND